MDVLLDDKNNNTQLIFKMFLLICGMFGFVFACSEFDSHYNFQELCSKAYNLDLGFVKIIIFVILLRMIIWYPYIIIYFFLLCEIVLDSKKLFVPWLYLSGLRLFINIIIMFTGLWIGFITNSNKWVILDFFLFKILQIGLLLAFRYALWILKQNSVTHNNLQLRKRRASFHGFGWNDKRSDDSLYSIMQNDSLSVNLNESPNQSDYIFVDAVRRSPSLDSLVQKNMVDWFDKEANTADEDDSSSFSFNLAMRAEKFLQLTPEELENALKIKSTKIMDEKRVSIDAFSRLPPLLTDNFIDLLNEKSELELNTIDMQLSKEKSSEIVKTKMPITLEILLSIFYKYHYFKPI